MPYGDTGAGTGAVLATTGAGVAGHLWLGVAIFVVGATLLALSRFGPRLALEPARVEGGRRRLSLTVNGKRRN